MRALSKDMLATELMGVDVDRVISFSFALSSLYAALGAYLWCFRFPGFSAYTGEVPALKAFIGAVVGGIGSIPGALLGAFLIGAVEVLFVGLFPIVSAWRDVFAFALLIVFLLLRPGGIANVKIVEEKV
jgi:branched-chain amino acid transport system permease protein